MRTRNRKPFGGDTLSKLAIGMAVVLVVLSGPKLFSGLLENDLVHRIANHQPYDESLVNLSDDLQQGLSLAMLWVYVPFFVVFLLWLRRRYLNLSSLGHDTTYQPGWAIGAFFVPLLNLVRPYQIVRETLKFSRRAEDGFTKFEGVLVVSWWIVFVADTILGHLVSQSVPRAGASVSDYLDYVGATAVSDFLECLLYPLYLLLLVWVGARQRRAKAEVETRNPEPVRGESP